jgi:hypothetical protein
LLCIPVILYSILFIFALFDPSFSMKDYRALVLFGVIFFIFAPIHAYFGFVVPNRSRKCLLDERYKALLGY